MNYTVKKVENKRDMREFVKLPRRIYYRNDYYVPDLESDVRNTFDPRKNAGLEHSEIQPFVVVDDSGRTVGRVAAIINRSANAKWNVKWVRFSFIEFIDAPQVSVLLMDAVAQWGKERGMDTVVGPLGITDFDKEGMLVEDFDQMGSMVTNYNLPYYPQHMERMGFTKAADWLQITVRIPEELPERYVRVARFVREHFGLRVRKVTNGEIIREGYNKKIFHLLNETYSPLFGFSELTDRQIEQFTREFLPLVDKRIMPLVENAQGELVGVAVTMASMSHALRKSGGRMWPIGWFHLLGGLKWKREQKAEMLLIAVRPDLQGKGVNALFFEDLFPIYRSYGFTCAETGPQLETNVRELSQWKAMNPTMGKRRRCYQKLIDA